MRSNEEKKTVTKSLKLSQKEQEYIQKCADEEGMSFGRYLVNCAIHKDTTVTPAMLVKLQEIVNTIQKLEDKLNGSFSYEKQDIREMRMDLDDLFSSSSHQQYYEDIFHDIAQIQEGSADLWGSLK